MPGTYLPLPEKRLGQVKSARQAFEKASALDSETSNIWMSLGAAQSADQDFDAVVGT